MVVAATKEQASLAILTFLLAIILTNMGAAAGLEIDLLVDIQVDYNAKAAGVAKVGFFYLISRPVFAFPLIKIIIHQ